MTEELKRDLEEGMRKFVFVEPNKARREMRTEIKRILQKHGISIDEGIVIAQGGGCIYQHIFVLKMENIMIAIFGKNLWNLRT